MVFSVYMRPLKMVLSFKYLGIVISEVEDDWPTVIQKLVKESMVWQRMTSILSREGVRPQVSIFSFKSVTQSVFLFGVETWVVPPPHGTGPGGFPIPGGVATYRAYSMAEAGQKVVSREEAGDTVGDAVVETGGN